MLITGALDFVVEPLRPLFDDDRRAPTLGVDRRRHATRGELVDVPPTGEARAQVMADYAAAEGLELEESVAYADSSRDLPMLEAVGFPSRSTPETRLAAIARKRGWLVEQMAKAGGGPRPLLPIGPPTCQCVARAAASPEARREGAALRTQDRPLRRGRAVAARCCRAGRPRRPAAARRHRRADLPGAGWVRIRPRLAGICGSDLATVDGRSSRYFEPIVSFPFVPGHEVVADIATTARASCSSRCSAASLAASSRCARRARRGDLGNVRAHRLRRSRAGPAERASAATPAAAGRPVMVRPRVAAARRFPTT